MDEHAPPSDAAKIQALLAASGVEDYEPRVVNQLQDFMCKYVTDILLDAEAYADQAGKPTGTAEMDDVMLAIQARTAYTFVQPPSQDALAALAKRTNAKEVPKFPEKKYGLLVPDDKECITMQGYTLNRAKALEGA